ncbi:MAG TPA: iron-containing alcohol dehydrogenase [Bacteroidaceae bacterium]|nr:iron-containing alcohol dehydrogenase [Bacteroidaceae bacterium]
MKIITFKNPARIVFGTDSLNIFINDCADIGLDKLFIITIPELMPFLQTRFKMLESKGIDILFDDSIQQEPSCDDVNRIMDKARRFNADGIAGIGGGSVMDAAKIAAALLDGKQKIRDVVGSEMITGRRCYLACLPTTSGTGSEVSPNSILIDPADQGKKGIISSFLVPDGAYIDPELAVGVPPAVTAATGIDALTHCIEAFTNKFAHPMTDLYALEGCRLIAGSLKRAFNNGSDMEARSNVALGSLYGGMCLGPVNTAGVHALAYPLGSKYKLPHGVANAVMLPYVMTFNIPGAVTRYKKVALAMGAKNEKDDAQVAMEGVKIVEQLIDDCKLPGHLSDYGIKKTDINLLVEEAMKIQRLLKNNPREISDKEAGEIFMKAL